MRPAIYPIGFLLLGLLITSCATTQSRYVRLGQMYSARAEDCNIELFRNSSPSKEFIKISRVDVHLEKTHFMRPSFENALPELKKQACLSGADAIIDIQERDSSLSGEVMIYHITATGIKYKE